MSKPKKSRKLIWFKFGLWTDSLADNGGILPKHAWAGGFLRVEPNEAHGIKPEDVDPKPINRLSQLQPALEDLIASLGITLHPTVAEQKFRERDSVCEAAELRGRARAKEKAKAKKLKVAA
jgi:hypothetical protein